MYRGNNDLPNYTPFFPTNVRDFILIIFISLVASVSQLYSFKINHIFLSVYNKTLRYDMKPKKFLLKTLKRFFYKQINTDTTTFHENTNLIEDINLLIEIFYNLRLNIPELIMFIFF
jgi:hypothetical protein